MAKQFNPFHHWLGLDESLTHPNHFELFGVKPNSDDPIGFRKNVHHRAKAMLAKLEKMPKDQLGERQKLHTRLRRHVVKAHETLMDDKLRAAYLKGLRQKAREAKGSAKPLAVPPPQKTSSTIDQAAAQTGKHEDLTLKHSSTPTIKQKSDVNLPSPEQAPIPMAIPLAKPDETPSANAGEVDFDHLKSEQISIRPGRLKRKKSWLIPILLVIMTLFCIAGIGALVTNFGNKITDPQPTVNNNVSVPVAGQTSPPKPEEPIVAPTPDEIRESTEKLVSETPEQPDAEMTMEDPGNRVEPKPEMRPKPSTKKETKAEALTTLNDSKLSAIRFLLSRARREMKRARLDSAGKQYDLAENLIKGKLDDSQSVITDEIKNGRHMIEHLEGFWKQVVYSSKNFAGGELEPMSGVIIGFVEGRDRDIVVKIGGENVTIPHQSLRPGLALELASKKGAPNVPDWRLQQAAFHVVHADGSVDLAGKIRELLELAEADEYPTEEIRGFWRSNVSKVFPKADWTQFAARDLKPVVQELTSGKYEKAERVEPQMAAQFATDLTAAGYLQPLRRIAALNESIKLSVRGGNAFQMVDSIDELGLWADVDTAEMKAAGFQKIARNLPNGAVPREIAESFFEFVSSADATKLKPTRLARLKSMFVDFANGYRLIDLKRLISQTIQ